MTEARALTVSSFTIIKGSLVEETYAAFRSWDFNYDKSSNLKRIKEQNAVGARSTNWLRDVAFVLSRRFDPSGRDRPLVELAQRGCQRDVWKPLLLWHITRDEFLLRDFLVHWLYPQFVAGQYRLRTEDAIEYLRAVAKRKDIEWSGKWTDSTTAHVAAGLLKIAVDFGLLRGTRYREFTSFHLPEESFLYLVYATKHSEPNARRLVHAEDWRMYLMDPTDVERELLRLHQFRKLQYEVAGSLAQLTLPYASTADYARKLCA